MEWFQSAAVTSILTAWDIAVREIVEETTAKIMLQKVADWVFSKRNCFLTSSASKIPVDIMAVSCQSEKIKKRPAILVNVGYAVE